MRKFDEVIVHCDLSDVPAHNDISVIDGWHKEKGFTFYDDKLNKTRHVGYHFYIKSDGTIQYGRPLWKVGAHCYGHNRNSISICLHGKTHFGRPQFITLANLTVNLFQVMGINKVRGHGFYDKKKSFCPGFDVYAMIKHHRPDIIIT